MMMSFDCSHKIALHLLYLQGFQLELEKAFVYVAHQLQEEGTDFDDYYLKHELYNDEQSSSSLELRRDLLESIGTE